MSRFSWKHSLFFTWMLTVSWFNLPSDVLVMNFGRLEDIHFNFRYLLTLFKFERFFQPQYVTRISWSGITVTYLIGSFGITLSDQTWRDRIRDTNLLLYLNDKHDKIYTVIVQLTNGWLSSCPANAYPAFLVLSWTKAVVMKVLTVCEDD
jgi:hypothetical protein